MFFKNPRIKDKKYLRHLSTLPCVCCFKKDGTVVGHHLLKGVYRGVGMKASDNHVLPICFICHSEIHLKGEDKHLEKYGITNPILLAEKYYTIYKGKRKC